MKTQKTNKKDLRLKYKTQKEQFKDFKVFWNEQYGDVTTKLCDDIFKLFLKKYKGDFRMTGDELNEFCKRNDEDITREDDIENRLWI